MNQKTTTAAATIASSVPAPTDSILKRSDMTPPSRLSDLSWHKAMDEKNYWQLGTWGRIPVAMHWTVLLVFAWMYLWFGTVAMTLVASAALFLVMVVHEMGHVAVLKRRKVAIESITFFGVHGTTAHAYAGPGAEVAVAWAGVGAQLLLLAATLILFP